jgi:hypothetical protein
MAIGSSAIAGAIETSNSNKNDTKKIDRVNFEMIELNFMLYRMVVLPLKLVDGKLVLLVSTLRP